MNFIVEKFRLLKRKSILKSILKSMEEIEKKIEKDIELKKQKELFSIFETRIFQDEKQEALNNPDSDIESLYTLYKANDDSHVITRELGELINYLLLDKQNFYGVHRTSMDIDGEILKGLLTDGLYATGHTGQGAFEIGAPNPESNFTPLNRLSGLINLLGSYKGSNLSIICKFPSKKVDESLNLKDRKDYDGVFIKTDRGYVVSPDNIVAIVSFEGENRYPTIYTKEQILSGNTR